MTLLVLVCLPLGLLLQVAAGELAWWQALLAWPLMVLIAAGLEQIWLRICRA